MPNAPSSAINVLDQRQSSGGARLLGQSKAGEWSVEMHQVIARRALADDHGQVIPGAKGDVDSEDTANDSGVRCWLPQLHAVAAFRRAPNTRASGVESDSDEFEKGTAKGVAIRSDGKLMPAPRFTSFSDPNLAYLWALRARFQRPACMPRADRTRKCCASMMPESRLRFSNP